MKAILQHVDPSLNQSFRYEIYEKKEFETPWHYHPEWELTYISESTGIRSVGNSIQNYNPGELVLVGPNLPHCWKTNTKNKTIAKSIVIQFNNNLLGEGWVEKNEFKLIKKLLNQSKYGLIFTSNTTEKIGTIMQEMEKMSPILRLIEFIKLLHYLSNSNHNILSLGTLFDTNQIISERIEKIMGYIEEHYQTKINSTQLGDLIFMTPVSFSKFFKKTFNKTFTSYLNEYRISKACELLKETEFSIEHIAFETGYSNLSFFHRQFKLYTNRTPKQYRLTGFKFA